MKKVSFFAMFAATALMMGVTSCSNDDNVGEEGQPVEGKTASLTITIDNPATGRATGTASTGDATVSNFTVFVVDDKDAIAWKQYVDLSSGGANPATLTVNTSAKEVYVIANAGNQSSYTTKAALVAATENLTSQYTGRWATGNVTIASGDWTTNTTTGDMEAQKTVDLQFIASRITVKVDNQMPNYDGTTPGTIILNDVAVLNANSNSLLFGSSLIPSGGMTFQSGLALTGLANWPSSVTTNTDLTDSYDNAQHSTAQDFHYYVYENNASVVTDFPTIVTVVGVDANGDDVYYPVHLAPYEQWATGSTAGSVERGKSYDITITLKGDAQSGNGGGTIDPTTPVTSAELEVTISITDWIPVALTKEFN